MKRRVLKEAIKSRVHEDKRLRGKLQALFGVSYGTVRRWNLEDHLILTCLDSLDIISVHLDIPADMLTEEKVF